MEGQRINIVLLGATGGIGTEILSTLRKKGDKVYIGSKTKSKVEEYCNKYDCYGEEIDVTDIDNFKSFFENANNHLEGINVIINCIGSILLKPSHLVTKNEIQDTFALNTFNAIGTVKYGIKYLKSNGGSILLFSSSAASIGLRNHDIISSAKGAIDSLVKSTAMTYANYNIRINAIAPGLVDTPLSSKITGNEVALNYSLKMHPLNKIGTPKNITKCVEWLIDPESDWVTGQSIVLDGGLSTLKC